MARKTNTWKRWLSFALTLVLLLSDLQLSIFAADTAPPLSDFTYTVNEEAHTVTLTKYTGTAPEPEVYSSYTVDGEQYKTVLASETVFRGNTVITGVKVHNGVAFENNSMGYLFAECTKLTTVNLSGVDTAGVTDMSYLFAGTAAAPSALTSVDLTGLNTASVTTMRGMFSYCTKLATITGYEDWDTGKLESMYQMFNRTSALNRVDLSKWDLDQVKNTGWCFQLCGAQEILLPDNLAVISAGFLNHATNFAGTVFTVPAGVKKIGYAHTIYDFATNDFTEFQVAEGNEHYKAVDGILYSIDGTEMLAVPRNKPFENGIYEIPEGVTFLGELSFSRNYNITKLVLPNSFVIENMPLNDPDYIVFEDVGNLNSGTNLSIAIYCYTGITEYEVKPDNPSYTSIDGIIYSKDMSQVVAIPARYAQEIVIPEGVKTWNTEALWADLAGNSNLFSLLGNCTGVSIPASLTSIDEAQLDMLNGLAEREDFTVTVDEDNRVFQLDENGKLSRRPSLSGKVISILGDSISTFAGYIPAADGFNLEHLSRYPDTSRIPDITEAEQTWWMQVIAELDAKLGINDSWRGAMVSGAAAVTTGTTGPNAAMSNLQRIRNLGANGTPDVILFYGGTNDYAHLSAIGTFDPAAAPVEVDLTTTSWNNLADAYVQTLLRLRYYYPDAVIVAMLPTYTASYYSDTKLSQGNAVLAEICAHYGIPCLDLRSSGVTAAHLPDGIHPGAEGMDLITDAVVELLLSQCGPEDGENVVYSVTHNLSGASASLAYFKGVTHGSVFSESITGDDLDVTVTMGGMDITAGCYADGKITITSVTGDLVITAKGEFNADGHLQMLPEELCCGTNLWSVMEHDEQYYTVDGWGIHSSGRVYSVTFPVSENDRIYATSFGAGSVNGSGGTNGIRVSYFFEDGSVRSLSADTVYSEFSANGYLTMPSGVLAVSVPMWSVSDSNELYILSAEHDYESAVADPTCTEKGYTTHTCACGESFVDSYVDATGKHSYDDGVCTVCGAKQEILSLRYDDHYDVSGKVVEILDAGNTVVTLEGDYLVATGIGSAHVKIDGADYAITVEKAKVNLVMVVGQSNSGNHFPNATSDVACPPGTAYHWRYGATEPTDYTQPSMGFHAPLLAELYAQSAAAGDPVKNVLLWEEGYTSKNGESVTAWAVEKNGVINTEGTDGAAQMVRDCLAYYEQNSDKYEVVHKVVFCNHGTTDHAMETQRYIRLFTAMWERLKVEGMEYVGFLRVRGAHSLYTPENADTYYNAASSAQFEMVRTREDMFMATTLAEAWIGPASTVHSIDIHNYITVMDTYGQTADYSDSYGNKASYADGVLTTTMKELYGSNNKIHYGKFGYGLIGADAAYNMYAALNGTRTASITQTDSSGLKSAERISAMGSTQTLNIDEVHYNLSFYPTCGSPKGTMQITVMAGDMDITENVVSNETATFGTISTEALRGYIKPVITVSYTYGGKTEAVTYTLEFDHSCNNGHSYESAVTAPTCTEKGYTTHTCHCGDSYVDSYVAANGHNYAEWYITTESKCEAVGEERRDCGSCDHYETRTVDSLGHKLTQHKAKAPACTAIGWNAYETCSRCDYTTYAELLATGHSYESIVTTPICTEQGYTTHTCHCGDSYVDSFVAALGHTEETISAVTPTCTATGLTEGKKCAVCDEVLTARRLVPAKGHGEVIDEALAPSCTSTGLTEGKHCSICDAVTAAQETIPAKGHTEETVPGAAPSCGREGRTEASHCSVCNIVMKAQETIPATGKHTYSGDRDADCEVCGFKREVEPEIKTTPMYRLYNPNSGEHFYTGSIEERDMLENVGWHYEGIAWNAPTNTGEPVYRLFNPNNGDHHYTMSAEERDMLVDVGWQYEGVAWNSASADKLPLYRLFNPNADCGSHHYTGSTEERDNLVKVGWIFEGIGWFGMLR